MIVHNCEQGTDEWLKLRLGIPTSSCFGRILTPKTMKASSQAAKYASELIAERFTGEPCRDDADSPWMMRGRELEPQARNWYAFDKDCEVDEVGFVTNDEGTIGCSPDGLIGDDGGIEIKCPSAAVHVEYSNGVDHKYNLQIQGCLWICERQWWDFVSFNPSMPAVVIRYERDEKVIDMLKDHIGGFNDMMAERIGKMEATGATIAKPKPAGPLCQITGEGGLHCGKPGTIDVGGQMVCESHGEMF